MKLEEFNFNLPETLIAQTPLEKRDTSKLMVVNRKTGAITHTHFYDIIQYLQPTDILVRNNTKVIPARLQGIKEETNGHVELLLLQEITKDHWQCLVGNARIVKVGTIITFGNGLLQARCTAVKEEGLREFAMLYTGVFYEILDQLGTMPLPPYIKEQLSDNNRYQTVYAKEEGSAAAPTAGLHFTDAILQTLKDKGITIVDVTLHVGLGTFRPVKEETIEKHHMHSEWYSLDEHSAKILNQAKVNKQRIISVGTTSTRVLESNIKKYGQFKATAEHTNIFIYPGYTYEAIDGLITNFHLPKSTLLMLVSAFSSRDYILHAYEEAIEQEYRFFSFGDCMFLI